LAAENLEALDSRRNLIWTREIVPEEFAGEEVLTVDLFDLLGAFRQLLSRLGEEARIELKRDNVSVAEKISWLTELLDRRGSLDLLPLLEDLPSKVDRVATFLALLEMVRLRLVVAFQRKLFGEIRLARVTSQEGGDTSREREE
jgi:segregation and condensation protein A